MSVTSLAAMAVNKTETTLRLNENDGYALMGVKTVTRAVVDTALTVAALAETVVFATLTILASPGGLFEMTSAPFNFAKEHTAEAGKATFNAFKGIAGYNSIAKEETAIEKVITRWEGFKAKMSDLSEKLSEFGSQAYSKAANLGSKIEKKHVLTGVAVTGSALAGIYFRSEIANGALSISSSALSAANTTGSLGMDYVLKPAFSLANSTIGDYAIRPVVNFASSFFQGPVVIEGPLTQMAPSN